MNYRDMQAFFVVVVFLGVVSFNFTQAIDDLGSFGNEDDSGEDMNVAQQCVWYIICDYHEIMEIKAIADALDNKTVLYVISELQKLLPDVDIPTESAFENEFWKNYLEDMACSLTKEDQSNIMSIPLPDYISEVCEREGGEEECDKMSAASELNGKMLEKYQQQCTESLSKEKEENLKQIKM
ncbi:uncharacterized protein TNCT_641211 [Trichonephila clavata]|uniref:Uncharacterized protein n=1 Tax=Trichonephila clavata TaxID=2740835 RepID=A0A8X6G0X3_TRICU|nr:uncharacterized protein TNCT_641211 [Trichonephila clavata]